MKVVNRDYDKIPFTPFDITARTEIGRCIEKSDVASVGDVVAELFENQDSYRDHIHEMKQEYFYNLGHSARSVRIIFFTASTVRSADAIRLLPQRLRRVASKPTQHTRRAQRKRAGTLNKTIRISASQRCRGASPHVSGGALFYVYLILRGQS